MPGSTSRALTLTARVFCLLMAALLTLFSLDAFSPDRPLAENLVAFAAHMLPTWVILLALILSWRRPLAAGLLTLGLGLVVLAMMTNALSSASTDGSAVASPALFIVVLPLLIIGGLFVAAWLTRPKPQPRG